MRIVSGGQTGVDRAALGVAIELGIEYGGWCPRGGLADDHVTPPDSWWPTPRSLRHRPTILASARSGTSATATRPSS